MVPGDRITDHWSCHGKSENLGTPFGRDEIGYCYPVVIPTLCVGKALKMENGSNLYLNRSEQIIHR